MTANTEFISGLVTKRLTISDLTIMRERIKLTDSFLEEVLRLQAKKQDMHRVVLEFISDAVVEYVLENNEVEWVLDQARMYGVTDFHLSALKQIQTLIYPKSEKLDDFLDCCAA